MTTVHGESLIRSSHISYTLDAPYNTLLTVQDCNDIHQLFQGTTRNPHHCISKGQYARLCEQLNARNMMLLKRIAKLEAVAKTVVECFDAAQTEGIAELLAASTDERLKDIINRRLEPAYYAAVEAIVK